MEQQHIIDQMRVEVAASNHKDAFDLQWQLSYQLHTDAFLQQLNQLLDSLVPDGSYLEIPSLSIVIDGVNDRNFSDQLLHALRTEIEQKRKRPADAAVVTMNKEAYETAVKSFFLRYGNRLMDSNREILESLRLEISQLPTKSLPELERLLLENGRDYPVVWKRLYYSIGAEGMRRFFMRLFAYNEERLQEIVHQVEAQQGRPIPDIRDPLLWQGIFDFLLSGRNEKGPIQQLKSASLKPASLAGDISNGDTAHRQKKKEHPAKNLEKELESGFNVENSGIVLLWLELGQLLRRLNYIIERQFADEAAKQRAIYLLHYVVYGRIEASEEELILNKVLCDWIPDAPVDPDLIPSENEKKEADFMLSEYISHWRKERKFSAQLFRTGFLQREGKLCRRMDGNWELIVRRKTEDVLIDKISVVRYSWMQHLLFVQW